MSYKTTDWDIKKAYTNYVLNNYANPLIFIDEYWDYYIKQLGQEYEYESFKDKYKSGGFESFGDFRRKTQELVEKCADKLFNTTQLNAFKKLEEIDKDIIEWNELQTSQEISNLRETTHMKLDFVSAWDQVLKYIDIFNNDYASTYDIINSLTDYDIFKNNKKTRILIYIENNLTFDAKGKILCRICNNILLKKIYESDNDVVKKLNSNCLAYKSSNDCILYDTGNLDNPMSLVGEYDIDGLKVHADLLEKKTFQILGRPIPISRKNQSKLMVVNKNAPFFPLCASLYKGQTPTEKDLAVGYEDKIFFHLNENDYEIL